MSNGVTGKACIWQGGFEEDRQFPVLVTQTEQQFYCEAGPVADAPGGRVSYRVRLLPKHVYRKLSAEKWLPNRQASE